MVKRIGEACSLFCLLSILRVHAMASVAAPEIGQLAGKPLSCVKVELEKADRLRPESVLSSLLEHLEGGQVGINGTFYRRGTLYTPLTALLSTAVMPVESDLMLFRWLLANGANQNCGVVHSGLVPVKDAGINPFFSAGSAVLLRELLAAGAQPVCLEDGTTGLHNALFSWRQQPAVIPVLVAHGVFAWQKNKRGYDPVLELVARASEDPRILQQGNLGLKMAALLACDTPENLEAAVSTYGQVASCCVEKGDVKSAQALGVLSRVLEGERERLKNAGYGNLSLQERFRKLYGDYITAQSVGGPREVPSEAAKRQWADTVFAELFPADVLSVLEEQKKTAMAGDCAEPIAKRLRSIDQKMVKK